MATYTLDLAERYLINLVIGASPQPTPEKMRLAITILNVIDLSYADRDMYKEVPIWEIVGEDPQVLEFGPDQAKFIAEVTVPSSSWSGDFLRILIPMWDRLYPQWEEFVPPEKEETEEEETQT